MEAGRRIRVLIVDDSAVMRSLLRAVICADSALDVAGTAVDGASALESIESLRPDLVLLDVEMPNMDGLATLKKLRARSHRMPVIMCSAATQRGGRVTIEALASGATDCVAKPANQISREEALRTLSQDLLPKIHAFTAAAGTRTLQGLRELPSVPETAHSRSQPLSVPNVLVIGVSTGGPAALDVLLPSLPAAFPLPVLIVQHMPELFTGLLAERLDRNCFLRVREASEGDPVRPGAIYLAPGNRHMEVLPASCPRLAPTLHIHKGPLENHCRPAVDVLFRSVSSVYGSGVIAVILTGMGSDGLAGCRVIRAQGGCVLAQNLATSTVWGMPGAVANAGLAHRVLPLNAIASEILRCVARSPFEGRELRESVV